MVALSPPPSLNDGLELTLDVCSTMTFFEIGMNLLAEPWDSCPQRVGGVALQISFTIVSYIVPSVLECGASLRQKSEEMGSDSDK